MPKRKVPATKVKAGDAQIDIKRCDDCGGIHLIGDCPIPSQPSTSDSKPKGTVIDDVIDNNTSTSNTSPTAKDEDGEERRRPTPAFSPVTAVSASAIYTSDGSTSSSYERKPKRKTSHRKSKKKRHNKSHKGKRYRKRHRSPSSSSSSSSDYSTTESCESSPSTHNKKRTKSKGKHQGKHKHDKEFERVKTPEQYVNLAIQVEVMMRRTKQSVVRAAEKCGKNVRTLYRFRNIYYLFKQNEEQYFKVENECRGQPLRYLDMKCAKLVNICEAVELRKAGRYII